MKVQVRCLLCGDCLCFDHGCTQPLLSHLQSKHPSLKIAPLLKTAEERKFKGSNSGKIICPSCQKESSIKKKRFKSRIGTSPLDTLFSLGCWPICFLPSFFLNNKLEDVHCPYCSQFLGQYDLELNIFRKKESKPDCALHK